MITWRINPYTFTGVMVQGVWVTTDRAELDNNITFCLERGAPFTVEFK